MLLFFYVRVGVCSGLVRVSSRSWALQPVRGVHWRGCVSGGGEDRVRSRRGDVALLALLPGSCRWFLVCR